MRNIMNIEETRTKLWDYLKEKQLSPHQFSIQSGISHPTLMAFLRGESDVRIKTLLKIERILTTKEEPQGD